MNGKLSINRLAMGSIRARKKQYVSLWIGIVLAVFFVSSLLLLAQSIYFPFRTGISSGQAARMPSCAMLSRQTPGRCWTAGM